jgi:ribosomal protein S18 acetylase RimI-like enzyme
MSVYFKRYRMRIDLPIQTGAELVDSRLCFLPWQEKHLELHALAKWESFRREMDASVFPCLGDREGCRQLMRDLSQKSSFVPEASWLVVADLGEAEETPVGTIQGLRTELFEGAIQNIAVVPKWRGNGIGRELIRRALLGFSTAGCKQVRLEVTIHNHAAIRLYENVGFRKVETVFKYGHVPIG